MPSALAMKLIGAGVGLLLLLGLVLGLKHYRNLANDRGAQLAAICTATRNASGNPKLDCKQVPQQIQFMGEAITTLTGALRKQNDAVAALGAQTKQQQEDSVKASQAAQKRAQGAEATAQRLEASSRAGGPPAASCEPSKAVKEAWQ